MRLRDRSPRHPRKQRRYHPPGAGAGVRRGGLGGCHKRQPEQRFLPQPGRRQALRGTRSGGKTINTASVLSSQGGILVPSYAATKAGIANLTQALANEWAPLGINVNTIAPSYFTTELTSALREDTERADALLIRIPAGRFGEPEDLKGAVVFLASDAADYVHGATLPVDGGWLGR